MTSRVDHDLGALGDTPIGKLHLSRHPALPSRRSLSGHQESPDVDVGPPARSFAAAVPRHEYRQHGSPEAGDLSKL